jgi:hypothetical protein
MTLSSAVLNFKAFTEKSYIELICIILHRKVEAYIFILPA